MKYEYFGINDTSKSAKVVAVNKAFGASPIKKSAPSVDKSCNNIPQIVHDEKWIDGSVPWDFIPVSISELGQVAFYNILKSLCSSVFNLSFNISQFLNNLFAFPPDTKCLLISMTECLLLV